MSFKRKVQSAAQNNMDIIPTVHITGVLKLYSTGLIHGRYGDSTPHIQLKGNLGQHQSHNVTHSTQPQTTTVLVYNHSPRETLTDVV